MRPQHFKPCPFCGSKIQIQASFGGHEYFYHLHLSEESRSAQRSKCILDGKHFSIAYDQGLYVAQWNNRPLESALQAENARLREALEPFAALLKAHHANLPDSQPIFGIEGSNFTVGDLRKARKALEGK